MKNIVLLLAVTLISINLFGQVKKRNSKIVTENIVVAHRGAWKKNDLSQNSIASLKQAIALKCAGSEFDVNMTADDSLVIFHDPIYNNLTIEKTNYADLISFKLSNGEKLPTLREYIKAAKKKNHSTKMICEIKPSVISTERGQLVATKAVKLMQELKAKQMVIYISFDYDILKQIVKINPKASTQYLKGDIAPEQIKADGITGVDYQISAFKKHPDWIESAKKNNIDLNVWTVDKADGMDWAIANGFNYITTDEPELLIEKTKK